MPATFLKSSKMHIKDLKQVGKRAVVVVQNMQIQSVFIHMRFVISLHGDSNADKPLPLSEIKLKGENFPGYAVSSSISWSPETNIKASQYSIFIGLLIKESENLYSVLILQQKVSFQKNGDGVWSLTKGTLHVSNKVYIKGEHYSEIQIAVLNTVHTEPKVKKDN